MVEKDPLRRQSRVIFFTFVTTPDRLEKNQGSPHTFLPRVELESSNRMGLKRKCETRPLHDGEVLRQQNDLDLERPNIDISMDLTTEETKASVIWALAAISQARGLLNG